MKEQVELTGSYKPGYGVVVPKRFELWSHLTDPYSLQIFLQRCQRSQSLGPQSLAGREVVGHGKAQKDPNNSLILHQPLWFLVS